MDGRFQVERNEIEELNRKAKETCEFEITASVECDEDIDYVV
jgi:hypothetical protein